MPVEPHLSVVAVAFVEFEEAHFLGSYLQVDPVHELNFGSIKRFAFVSLDLRNAVDVVLLKYLGQILVRKASILGNVIHVAVELWRCDIVKSSQAESTHV